MADEPWLYARNEDPDTSHEAADQLNPEAYWKLITDFLAKHDRDIGWIEAELVIALGVDAYTLSKRLSDVRREGLAEWAYTEAGFKITRPGPSNRLQGASRVTDRGRVWLTSGEPVPKRQSNKSRVLLSNQEQKLIEQLQQELVRAGLLGWITIQGTQALTLLELLRRLGAITYGRNDHATSNNRDAGRGSHGAARTLQADACE